MSSGKEENNKMISSNALEQKFKNRTYNSNAEVEMRRHSIVGNAKSKTESTERRTLRILYTQLHTTIRVWLSCIILVA